MADYTIRIEADTRDSQDKVERLDQRLNEVERPRKIDIHLPTLQESISGVKALGDALKTTFNTIRAIPGNPINDLDQIGDVVTSTAQKAVDAAVLISKATPTNILANSFTAASDGAVLLSKNIASLGYQVFGITQSVNILKSAFGGMFDETIGREIRLQESLLRTKTTLVSTADVAVNGKRLTDPFEAILKLEKPIEKTINNIRLRSLDIAGTTSEAIVQTFGVVASQIGSIGGSIKDAEDLSISFAGALGTLGLSDPMYASQEIRSILTGNIDQNSVLARSLGLTNEEVAKAKKSADGLVGYLQKRLEAFTAGQSLAAKGFGGIVSNIQEVQQELSRTFGKPFLQPLLDGLTKVYERLQIIVNPLKKTRSGDPIPGPLMGAADAVGRSGAAVLSGVAGAAMQAPSLSRITQKAQYGFAENMEKSLAQLFLKVQSAVDKIRPQIAAITEEAAKAAAVLLRGLTQLAVALAQFKFENLRYMLLTWTSLANTLNNTVVPAFALLLEIYTKILENPLFQGLSQYIAQWQALERIGILPIARSLQGLMTTLKSVMSVLRGVSAAITAIGAAFNAVLNVISVGVAGLINLIRTSGAGIIQALTVAIQGLLVAVRAVFGAIGNGLFVLSALIVRLYPQFTELALLIARVGTVFANIGIATRRAQTSVTQFTTQAVAALERLGITADVVRAKIGAIGLGIKEKFGQAAGAIGSFSKNLIGSLASFFIWQFAIMAGITLIFDQLQRNKERQQDLSDRTRAEIAVRRLSSAYKDLGENASLAARKAKELEESIVNNRYEDVSRKVEELSKKIRDYKDYAGQQKQFRFDFRSLVDPSLWKTSAEISAAMTPEDRARQKRGEDVSTNAIAARIEQRKLEAERYKLAQEAQKLLQVKEKAEATRKSTEDVQILAKERKDLEKTIADYRKALNKEITDAEFNSRQERLQIEQTAREAQRSADSAQMARDMERNLAGVTGVRRQVAEVLNTYQKRLFDAQTESQRRQFEFARTREKFEKNLADYKLKLEEQTAKLRQRMTDYSAKVTKWENEERLKTSRRILEDAIKAGTALTGKYTLLPEDRTKFIEAATKAGYSPTRALAVAKTVDSSIISGWSPDMSPDELVGRLSSLNQTSRTVMTQSSDPAVEKQRVEQLVEMINKTLKQQTGGQFVYQSALDDLQTRQYLKTTPSSPPKAPGINDILSENRKAIDAMDRQQSAQLAAMESLNKMRDALDRNTATQEKFAALSNIFMSGIVDIEQLKSDVNLGKIANSQLLRNLSLGRSYNDPGQAMLEKTKEEYRLAATMLRDKGLVEPAPNTTWEQTMKNSLKLLEDTILKGLKGEDLDVKFAALKKNNPTMYGVFRGAVLRGVSEQESAPYIKEKSLQDALKETYMEIEKVKTTFTEELISGVNKIFEALLPDNPIQRRLFQANQAIGQRQRAPELQEALKSPEFVKAFNTWGDAVRLSATKLGEFDSALADFATKIALIKDAAATITDGLKTSFKDLLNGKINGFEALVTTMREKLTTAFADWAFAPIQAAMEEQLRKIFKTDSEAQKLADLQKAYTQQFETAVKNFYNAVDKFTGGPGSTAPAAPGTPTPAPAPGAVPEPAPSAPPAAKAAAATSGLAAASAASAAAVKDTTTALGDLGKGAAKAKVSTQELLGGLATMAAGIGGIVAGFQQMGKKGASNTLMGLSSIFIGLGSTLMGAKSAGIFRAAGGPVSASSPYIVGEKGPEWFVPNRSGIVLPHGSGPGGGGGVNSVVNVHLSDSGARTDNNQASQLGRMIDSAVINVINRERRPGGVLAYR